MRPLIVFARLWSIYWLFKALQCQWKFRYNKPSSLLLRSLMKNSWNYGHAEFLGQSDQAEAVVVSFHGRDWPSRYRHVVDSRVLTVEWHSSSLSLTHFRALSSELRMITVDCWYNIWQNQICMLFTFKTTEEKGRDVWNLIISIILMFGRWYCHNMNFECSDRLRMCWDCSSVWFSICFEQICLISVSSRTSHMYRKRVRSKKFWENLLSRLDRFQG